MKCSRCTKDLPETEFRKHSKRCHRCLAEVAKEYRLQNYEKHLACLRRCYENKRAERLEYSRQYHAAHKHERKLERMRIMGAIWRRNNREKVNAKAAVLRAIKDGKLIRPPKCSICSKEGWIVGHHKDYTKPLEVTWVCQGCHRDIHLGRLQV